MDLLPTSINQWSGTETDISNLIQYNDRHLLVIYKPPQILSQSEREYSKDADEKAGPQSNLQDLLKAYRNKENEKGSSFVGLVHRLDRPTSGLMIYAKHHECLKRLNEMFAGRAVGKSYLAIVNGKMEGEGKLVDFLQKRERSKSLIFSPDQMMNVHSKEVLQSLLTQLRSGNVNLDHIPSQSFEITSEKLKNQDNSLVIGLLNFKSLLSTDVNQWKRKRDNVTAVVSEKYQSVVDISLGTGRKHQIRAQLAAHGYAIVGDRKYGAAQRFETRDICLHAYRLSFPHPMTGDQRLSFSIQPPRIWNVRFPKPMMEAVENLILSQ